MPIDKIKLIALVKKYWIDVILLIIILSLFPFAFAEAKRMRDRPRITQMPAEILFSNEPPDYDILENRFIHTLESLTENNTSIYDVDVTLYMDSSGNASFSLTVHLEKGEYVPLD